MYKTFTQALNTVRFATNYKEIVKSLEYASNNPHLTSKKEGNGGSVGLRHKFLIQQDWESRSPVIQGQVLDFSAINVKKHSPDKNHLCGVKKASNSFSNSSARSLSKLFASLDFSHGLFLTLTQAPGISPIEAKAALDRLFKRLSRAYPMASAVWRLERQRNGSPHFHILIFGVALVDVFNWNPAKNWRDVVGVSVSNNAIDMQIIRKNAGAFLYLVGHGSKKNQTWENQCVGRYWGKHNKSCLPYAKIESIKLDLADLNFLRIYWENQESKRVSWLKSRYPLRNFTPRDWISGPLKLFPVPISKIIRIFRIFIKKNSLQIK